MELTEADLIAIRDLAQINFMNFKVNPAAERLFNTRCFAEATLHFLNSKGYELIKWEKDKDVE